MNTFDWIKEHKLLAAGLFIGALVVMILINFVLPGAVGSNQPSQDEPTEQVDTSEERTDTKRGGRDENRDRTDKEEDEPKETGNTLYDELCGYSWREPADEEGASSPTLLLEPTQIVETSNNGTSQTYDVTVGDTINLPAMDITIADGTSVETQIAIIMLTIDESSEYLVVQWIEPEEGPVESYTISSDFLQYGKSYESSVAESDIVIKDFEGDVFDWLVGDINEDAEAPTLKDVEIAIRQYVASVYPGTRTVTSTEDGSVNISNGARTVQMYADWGSIASVRVTVSRDGRISVTDFEDENMQVTDADREALMDQFNEDGTLREDASEE